MSSYKQNQHKYEPMPGLRIDKACKEAVQIAIEKNAIVLFKFNGIELKASPTTDPVSIVKEYSAIAYDNDQIHILAKQIAQLIIDWYNNLSEEEKISEKWKESRELLIKKYTCNPDLMREVKNVLQLKFNSVPNQHE